MATILKRKGKRGVSFRATVCVNGQRKSATFDSRAAAMLWAEEAEGALRNGGAFPGQDLPENDLAFVDAAERYLAHVEQSRLKEPSKYMYRQAGARLIEAFQEKSLRTLTRQDVALWRERRGRVVGPASIRHAFVFLRQLYKFTRLELGIDAACPVDDVQAPSPPKNREPLLTLAEIERLLDFCCASQSEKLYTYVLLLLHTAMRPSEAASLTWAQVRFNERVISLTETKTGKSRRVPLTNAAMAALQTLKQEVTGELVFLPRPPKQGEPASAFFRRAFATACKNANIPDITLYSLRHIAASYLVMRGVDMRTVAEIMGHSDISMTMKYAHLLDTHKLSAIAALDILGR